jgi:hypothetical protein
VCSRRALERIAPPLNSSVRRQPVGNVLAFWSRASAEYVVGMWWVTALLLAVAVWFGFELARARQLLKVPFVAVVSGSTVILLLPLFVTTIEGLRLFALLYVVLLVWAIVRAAPYGRALGGIAAFLVWLNIGTVLTAMFWGV